MTVSALGPADTPVRPEMVDAVVRKVNDAVRTNTVEDHRWGMNETAGYWFVVPGTLNAAEKRHLVQTFQSAGWGVVQVRNSEENGERPGLCTAILRF